MSLFRTWKSMGKEVDFDMSSGPLDFTITSTSKHIKLVSKTEQTRMYEPERQGWQASLAWSYLGSFASDFVIAFMEEFFA